MERETTGTVSAVARQWWLKVNSKPLRICASDGAAFPHVIKVCYEVDGKRYIRKKWVGAGSRVPSEGDTVKVFYHVEKPSKARVALL